jgi:Domian of unknown function (DUF4952)
VQFETLSEGSYIIFDRQLYALLTLAKCGNFQRARSLCLGRITLSCLTLVFALLACTSAALAAATPKQLKSTTEQSVVCGDFLANKKNKPSDLKFVECKKINLHGVDALEAVYRVSGAKAASVETSLVKSTKMPKLRYVCCGWESSTISGKSPVTAGSFLFKKNWYEVSMTSGESPINQRAKWGEIEFFSVSVVLVVGEV